MDLPAPDAAPEIEALFAHRLRPPETRQDALALRHLQLFAQLLQPKQRGALNGVGAQHAFGHAGVVDRLQMLTHEAFLASFARPKRPPGNRRISFA
jgi:hypothetical protein